MKHVITSGVEKEGIFNIARQTKKFEEFVPFLECIYFVVRGKIQKACL